MRFWASAVPKRSVVCASQKWVQQPFRDELAYVSRRLERQARRFSGGPGNFAPRIRFQSAFLPVTNSNSLVSGLDGEAAAELEGA